MIRFRLADVKIRLKLFLLLQTMVLVPFVIYTLIVMDQSAQELGRLGTRSASQVLKQTDQFLESRVATVKRALDFLSLNTTVHDLITVEPSVYDHDLSRWNLDARALRTTMDALRQNNPDLVRFVLYMDLGLGASTVAAESTEFRPLESQRSQPWYQRFEDSDRGFLWFPASVAFEGADGSSVRGVRRITDDLDLGHTIGFIRADLPQVLLVEILDQAEFSANTSAFLVNQAGETVAVSATAQRLGLNPKDFLALEGTPHGDGWRSVRYQGQDYLSGALPVEGTDWSLCLAVPSRDISAFGDRTKSGMLTVLLIMVPLILPLSLSAAAGSTRRLGTLLDGVRKLQQGGLDVVLPVEGQDELGELTDNFNRMVEQIRALAADQYRLGQEVKSLELMALQAQINPHFLYNTLDLVNVLALKIGPAAEPVNHAVEALSKFYRLSLSGGTDSVPLAKEVDHAAAYLAIQNLRFGAPVRLVVNLEPGTEGVIVPKMILQPLVENALLHGILESDLERGTITVAARWVAGGGKRVRVEVTDDGVGMAEPVLRSILTRGPDGADDHGYGVTNIDQRLKLKYGGSGLRFTSQQGQGTTVQFEVLL